MLRHITVCFAFFALLLAAQEADESYNITKQSFPYIVIIRVKTMTEKSAKINNPVRWLPLSELIPDGTLVKKDQVNARFNTENSPASSANRIRTTSASPKAASVSPP